MPINPLHLGSHTCVGLPLPRSLDVPVFLGANLVLDLEPLAVMTFHLAYPLHDYCHTLLVGGCLDALWGLVAYPFRKLLGALMQRLRLAGV